MNIIDIRNKENYLKEYLYCCCVEWSSFKDEKELNNKIKIKYENIINNKNKNIIFVLGLINQKKLVGFISLFKTDGNYRKDLSPWYATMFVKKEYRGNGYSKILNDACLNEAKKLGYNKIYLKTELNNYYEKFGAKYMGKLNDIEKLYYFELS